MQIGHRAVVAVAAVVLAGVVPFVVAPVSGAGAATVSSWSIMPGATSTTSERLVAVSCSATSACTAVGYSDTTPFDQATSIHQVRAESLEGSTWVASAPVDVAADDRLDAVSCVTATFCMAVGYSGEVRQSVPSSSAFAEQWDGAVWSVVPTPSVPSANSLSGISCTSATHCVAVGSDGQGSLVETWDGAAWSVTPTPASAVDGLAAVTCWSASGCMAVGSFRSTSAETAVVFDWDGSAWTSAPAPSSVTDVYLQSVSCTSAVSCVAVGATEGGRQALAVTWNGATWSTGTLPDPSATAVLQDVSCASPTACTAVGPMLDGSGVTVVPLADAWDGSTWTQTDAEPVGSLTEFDGVGCVSTSACVVVGHDDLPGAPLQELTEQMVPDPSTGSLAMSPSTGVFKQPVTLTDSLVTSSTDPGGTVTFTSGGVTLCTTAVVSGTATCRTSALEVGVDTVFAVYTGDLTTGSSTATTTVAVTGPDPTTVAQVLASPDPQEVGMPVTYSAAVGDVLGGTIDVGTVTFTSGSTALCTATVSADQATCTSATAPIGTDTVTAAYAGTTGLQPSTGSGSLTVNTLEDTVTTATVTPGTVLPGTPVTYGATVSAATGVPTGTVTFLQGVNVLCSAALASGSATCISAAAADDVGVPITATYGGDAADNPSSGTTTLTMIPPSAVVVTTQVAPDPVLLGAPVQYTATVTSPGGPGVPTGTVWFTTGSVALCSAPLVDGTATCTSSAAPVGTGQAVTSEYGGAPDFQSGSGYAVLTVVAPVPTATSVSVEGPSTAVGATSTYTAVVTPAPSTPSAVGAVTFTVGTTSLCSAPLVAGVATCRASVAPVGVDQVTATYGGTVPFAGSAGTVTQVVTRLPVVRCGKLTGRTTSTLMIASCTPMARNAKTATVPGSLLSGSATVRWSPGGQTSVLQVTVTTVGRGGCPEGTVEVDVVGYVSGGTSTYAPADDPVAFRACERGTGRLTLVPGTGISL